jgi:AmmeMemoRadiSam system protein A
MTSHDQLQPEAAMPMLDDHRRAALLKVARDALTAHVTGASRPSPPASGDLARPAGAFVTLHNHGELRGCIGHIEADQPLGDVIAHCAIAAATSDPRFPAVTSAELPHLVIELSILGPLEPIQSLDHIEIGRDGLVVELGWHRGLLLPQVATEWNWDRLAFVEQTCHKAGLRRDAWKHGAKLWKFRAEVFGEREPTA